MRISKPGRIGFVVAIILIVVMRCGIPIFQRYRALQAIYACDFDVAVTIPAWSQWLPEGIRQRAALRAVSEINGLYGLKSPQSFRPHLLNRFPELVAIHMENVHWLESDHWTAIADLHHLRVLSLPESSVGDQGIRRIASSRSIEQLRLDKTSVSDKCIESLMGMQQLKFLDIRDTAISPNGRQRLASLLPNCQIEGP